MAINILWSVCWSSKFWKACVWKQLPSVSSSSSSPPPPPPSHARPCRRRGRIYTIIYISSAIYTKYRQQIDARVVFWHLLCFTLSSGGGKKLQVSKRGTLKRKTNQVKEFQRLWLFWPRSPGGHVWQVTRLTLSLASLREKSSFYNYKEKCQHFTIIFFFLRGGGTRMDNFTRENVSWQERFVICISFVKLQEKIL